VFQFVANMTRLKIANFAATGISYNSASMRSVVITTDVFRGAEFCTPSVAENVHWLRGLLHNVFSAAGFVQTIFTNEYDGGRFAAAHYRQSHDLPRNACSWAKLVNARISPEDEFYFAELFNAELVIGWGLTPALMELLDRRRISFVDVEVDPIRFGDDLFLRARTNNPRLREYFSFLHVDEVIFSTSVAELRAFVARREAATVKAGRSIGLFAGQCSIDLSIVESGRIVGVAEWLKEIAAIAQTVDTFFVKPHPFASDADYLDILLDAIPNARMTRSNIYRVLSDVNLKHVISLSSSVLDEAAVFGVDTTKLIEPDREASDLIPLSTSQWYRIPSEELTHDGFVNAFLGTVSPLSNGPRRRLDLRRSLNTAWGLQDFYNQADLSLSIASHASAIAGFPHRKVLRALKSIF
jgi:hypothetical protein